MRINISLALFLIMLLTFPCIHVKAQSINGDTIYVDTQAEIAYRFPSNITKIYTVPADAPYDFKSLEENGFSIISRLRNSKPTPLFVIEGKRTHHFLIMYKKNINYNNFEETDHDYSSLKKLEQHIQNQGANALRNTAKKDNTDEIKQGNRKTKVDENDPALYYPLLESGDQKLRK